MGERDRNDHGRYADGIDPETVLDVFDARDDLARPITAGDVVDELDIARRTAHNKLNRLVERGVLETRKIGARGRVWWRPITADAESGRERAETTVEATADPTTTKPDGAREDTAAPRNDDTTRDRGGATGDSIADAVDATDDLRATVRPALAGDGDLLERRVDAILRMYAYLREHGTAEKNDLLDVVDSDVVDYADAESVWSNMVKGKDTLRALPGVRTPTTGKGTWRYEDE